jgi:GDP/UDP-N,N'-diacetylbacillosamine 2-epimerase (hydrolysing)
LAQVDGVVGNSSSGLAEAPSFKKGTINIGNRQSGRLQATSIINCEPNKHSIDGAIKILYSNEFQSKLRKVKNPYGEGGASEMIVKLLKGTNIEGIIFKEFYDFPRVVKANTV